MFERYIYSALVDGIAELVAKPRRLQTIFTKLKLLTVSEAEKLTDVFRRQPPAVLHQYPRDDTVFPAIAIILGDEAESTEFLDTLGNIVEQDEAALLSEPGLEDDYKRATIYTQTFHMWIVTEKPDLTIAYYQLAKYILMQKRTFLKDAGALDIVTSGGDLAPNATYMPAHLFIRRLTIQVQVEENAFETPEERRARSVTGIFINDGAIAADIGSVNTNVTPIFGAAADEE